MKKLLFIASILLILSCEKTIIQEPERCTCFVRSINRNHIDKIAVYFGNGEYTELDPYRIKEGLNMPILDHKINIKFYFIENNHEVISGYEGEISCNDTIIEGGIGIINIISYNP